MDLENRNAALQEELSLAPAKRAAMQTDWVPRAPASYTLAGSSMPDISSEGSEPIVFTPRRVRHAIRAVQGALDRSRVGGEAKEEGEDDWEGVKAVRDFFEMFSEGQSQSDSP